jgi:ABC-type transport system involved in multi-copper enzyme maturation permease subunit
MNDVTCTTTRALVLRLMAKDVYLNRQMMIAALIGGSVSLILAGTSRLGYDIGSVSFITTMMAFGVILAMYSITQERKDRSAMFVLSLPLAPMDYVRAKLLGTTLTYFIPWSVLSAGAILVIALTPIPDGLMPMTVLLLVYFLFTFSVMTLVALLVSSEAKTMLAIIGTNMSLTFFMFGLARSPGIGFGLDRKETPLWTGSFFALLATELTLIAIALAIPLCFNLRRKEFL